MGVEPSVKSRELSMNTARTTALGVFFVAAVLIVIAGLLFFRHYSARIIIDAQQNLYAVSELESDKLGTLVHERFSDANIFVDHPAVQLILDKRIQGPALQQEMGRVTSAIEHTSRIYGYTDIFVLDLALRVVAPATAAPLQPAERSALETAIRTGQPVLADIHIGPGGEPDYGIAQPVFTDGDASKPVLGAAFLERNGRKDLFPMMTTWPTSSASAETILLRRDGEQALYINPPRLDPSVRSLSMRRSMSEKRNAAVRALEAGDGLVEGIDYRGAEVVGAAHRIEGTPWVMLSKVDREEIERPVRTLMVGTAALMAMLLAASGAIPWYLWRSSLQRLSAERAALAERYATAARTSIDGYIVTDGTSRLLEVNPAVVRISGYSESELLGMSIHDLDAIESPEDTAARTTGLVESGGNVFQSRWKRKDGALIDVEVSATYLSGSNGGQFHAFVRDITRRKEMEEAIAQSRKLLQDVIDNSGSLVYAFDKDGRCLLINRATELAIGATAATALGKPRETIMPADAAAAHRANDLQVMQGQKSVTTEEDNIEADGRHTYISVKFPLIDTYGAIYGVAGVSTDITERKRTEEKVDQQLQELKRWYEATLGREDRILELKREVNALCKQLGQTPPYGRMDDDAGAAAPLVTAEHTD